MRECTHDCSTCSSNCGERTEPQSFLESLNPKSSVKKVIGIVSGKGGVGKSLITSLLAVSMQRKGKKAAI
ncbi:MAG: P-loop NTPase, partial [Clostridia bacterium]|nr:P-loop NTPase [Clostridia bacterium]